MAISGHAKLIYTLMGGAMVFSCVLYTIWMRSAERIEDDRHQFGQQGSTAIVILGGGLLRDGSVPSHTLLRIERAVQIYHDLKGEAVIIPLSGGTPHKPNPLDIEGFPVWESTAAARKLLEMGIPASKVLEENFSLDTIGNAYFLRMVHVETARYRRLIVITNTWHMPRTAAIFDTVFNLPMTQGSFHSHAPSLQYETVAAGIADEDILGARTDREKQSTATFLDKTQHLWRTMEDLHTWLYQDHGAYAAKRLVAQPMSEEQKKVNQLALSTY